MPARNLFVLLAFIAACSQLLLAQSQTTTLNYTNTAVFDTQISGPNDDPATTTRDEPNHNFDSFFAINARAGTSTRQLSLLQTHGFVSNLRIPPGSTITSATLRLYLNDDLTTGYPRTVRLHRMLKPWTTDSESPTTWNNPDNAFGTDGIALDDTEAAAAATAEITLDQGAGRFVTANVTADVQAWVNGTANFGWVILTDNSADSAGFRTTNHALFNTAEVKPASPPPGTPADPILPLNKTYSALTNSEWRQVQSPTLVITYTPAALATDTKLTDAAFFAALNYAAHPGLAAVNTARQAANYALARTELAAYLRARTQPVVPDPADFTANIASTPPTAGTTRLAASTPAEKALTLQFTADATTYQFTGGLPLDWEYSPNNSSNFSQYLNRFSYGEDMAKAFATTGNPLYLAGQTSPRLYGFAEILRDWITGNPAPAANLSGGGIQSWTTMQAGLRAGHFWPRAWQRVVRSPAFPADTLVLWMKSYYEHAEYLRQYTGSGNGLAMEINGLFTASVLFPEFTASATWRQTALDRLAAETGPTGQVYADGAQTELTPLYHFTTLRHFANVVRAAQANAIPLPASASTAVESLFDYALDIAEPSFAFPDWNDSDPAGSGSLSSWMPLAAALYPARTDFQYFATNRVSGTAPAEASFLLPYAGQALMRSGWDAQARYLAFEGGPLGTAHHHDDKLGLVLTAFGERLVIDSGRYAYDNSDFSAYSKSAHAHSVVHIGDFRQSRRLSTGVQRADSPYDIEWRTNSAFDYTTASFGDLSGEVFRNGTSSSSPTLPGATHRRHLLFVKPHYWIVVDDITQPDSTSRPINQQFHLANHTTSIDSGTQRVTLQKTGGPSLTLTPLVEGGLTASVISGQTTPELLGWQMSGGSGTATAIPVARFTRNASGRVQLATVLAPAATGTATPTVTRLATGDPDLFAVRVTWSDGKPATDFIVNLDRTQPLTWNSQDYSTGSVVVQNSTVNAFGQSVAVTTANVTEGTHSQIRFTLTRSGGDATQPLTVPFTLGGTAIAGTDYTAPGTSSVSFSANQTTAYLDLPLLNDSASEPTKALTLTLQSGSGFVLDPARTAATTIIADDDFVITTNTADALVPTGGTGSGTITVSRPSTASGSATYTLVLPSSNYAALKTGQDGGPGFVWDDISVNGGTMITHFTHAEISGLDTVFPSPAETADDAVSTILSFSGGFAFPFYGEICTRLRVGTNGYVTLGTNTTEPAKKGTATSYFNLALPTTQAPPAALFAFWEDLYLDTSGGIYVKQLPDRYIVQWQNIRTFNNANIRVTFQAILFASGSVEYHYLAAPTSGVSYTIGQQNRSGTQALPISHNTTSVGSYTSVRVTAPNSWLSASTTSVTVAPGASATFTINYNAAGLGDGLRQAEAILYGDGLPSAGQLVPVSIDIGGTAGLAQVQIQATDSTATEVGDPGAFTVTRTGDISQPLTVHLAWTGTATATADYTALPTSVTIPAGLTTATLPLIPVNDSVVETNASETVIGTIQPHAAYGIGLLADALVTIADNDTYANTKPANPSVTVLSPTSVRLDWTDNFEDNTEYRVRYTTDGTTFTGITIAGTAGPTTTSYTFTGLATGVVHQFSVRAQRIINLVTTNSLWSDPVSATPANPLPAVTITAPDATASESGDTGTFTITRSGDTAAPLTIHFTVSGTASAGSDYTTLPTSITIPSDQASATLTVTPIDDNLVEADTAETVIATLATDPAYTIGGASTATVTLTENDTHSNTPVANVAVTVASSTSLTLTWTDNFETNTKYRVRRSTNADMSASTGFDAGANDTAYTFTGLTPGTTYYVQIRAEKTTTTTYTGLWSAALAATPSAANAWLQQHFASTAPALWSTDPDGDGVINLLEYAHATDPHSAAVTNYQLQITNDNLRLTFLRARADLTYEVLASSDLSTWSVIATNPGTVSLTEPVTVTDTVSLSDAPRRFLRLRVAFP